VHDSDDLPGGSFGIRHGDDDDEEEEEEEEEVEEENE
jgi:hypothetical protein